ncbi:hypothetical protein YC2023_040833 [Brassica napus]
MGGNAKKRLVQSFVSPRKKAMAKQASKAGDKGPVPTKKALLPLIKSGSWNKGVGSRIDFLGLCLSIMVYLEVWVIALVMRSLGYRSVLALVSRCSYSYLHGLWRWLMKWMKDWNVYWYSSFNF